MIGLLQANDGKMLVMMVKWSSMMVNWVYDYSLISPSLSSISPLLAWSIPSFAHLTIIEKLHQLQTSIGSSQRICSKGVSLPYEIPQLDILMWAESMFYNFFTFKSVKSFQYKRFIQRACFCAWCLCRQITNDFEDNLISCSNFSFNNNSRTSPWPSVYTQWTLAIPEYTGWYY